MSIYNLKFLAVTTLVFTAIGIQYSSSAVAATPLKLVSEYSVSVSAFNCESVEGAYNEETGEFDPTMISQRFRQSVILGTNTIQFGAGRQNGCMSSYTRAKTQGAVNPKQDFLKVKYSSFVVQDKPRVKFDISFTPRSKPIRTGFSIDVGEGEMGKNMFAYTVNGCQSPEDKNNKLLWIIVDPTKADDPDRVDLILNPYSYDQRPCDETAHTVTRERINLACVNLEEAHRNYCSQEENADADECQKPFTCKYK